MRGHDALRSVFDRRLLATAQKLVPTPEREDWVRGWYAELWHARESRSRSHLTLGLVQDALWLRCESWRCAYSGGASLCVTTLVGLCVMSLVLALLLAGGWRGFGQRMYEELPRFLLGSAFLVFVAYATSPRRHTEHGWIERKTLWLKRQMFFIAKTALLLLFTSVMSMNLCQPMYGRSPLSAVMVQMLLFVFFSLLGMRWNFSDQQQRCKQCLRQLKAPARVGRPSHNLLEWNGTSLQCHDGHGLLNVPEMETSWCDTSHWTYQDRELA